MSVIEFPGPTPPPEGYSEQYIAELHSKAFRDLEPSLRDCVRMGELVVNVACGRIEDSTVSFAVQHLGEMLTRLEKEYDARWHGEVRGS